VSLDGGFDLRRVDVSASTQDHLGSPVAQVEVALRVQGDRVADENSLGIVLRILTGFPPRYFVGLDPR
jgi:hypothetical protein